MKLQGEDCRTKGKKKRENGWETGSERKKTKQQTRDGKTKEEERKKGGERLKYGRKMAGGGSGSETMPRGTGSSRWGEGVCDTHQ